MSTEKIAIIGLSGIYPGAADLDSFAELLTNGADCIRPMPDERKAMSGLDPATPCLPIGYLDHPDHFDFEFFGLSRKEAEYMDPHQRLLLMLACHAIENAGYSLDSMRGARTAVFVSSAGSGYRRLSEGFDPMLLSGNIPAALAGRISYTLDLRGPAMVIDTACSSSLVAVIEACRRLRAGEVDLALAGGVNIFFAEDHLESDSIGIIASDGRSKAFDASADGSGWGEGGGMILLKPLDRALRDRDRIHGVILGGAVNQDGGRSNGLTAPSPEAQRDVILEAWRVAGIDPRTISYIEAHGTGTKLGDPIEIQGITQAFRQFTPDTQFCGVGSVKTNIGHLVGAAGIAGLTKILLSFRRTSLFPSLHFQQPNRFIDFQGSPVYVNAQPKRWNVDEGIPRRAGISSFGLSGTNSHLVLEEPPFTRSSPKPGPVLMKVSARSELALERYAEMIALTVASGNVDLGDLAFTLDTGRGDYPFRAAVVASDRNQAAQALRHRKQASPADEPRPIVLVLSDDASLSDTGPAHPATANRAFREAAEQIREFAAEQDSPALRQFTRLFAMYRAAQAAGLEFRTVIGSGVANVAVKVITGKRTLPAAVASILETPPETSPVSRDKLRLAIEQIGVANKPLFLCAGEGGSLAETLSKVAGELPGIAVSRLSIHEESGLLPSLAQAYTLGANLNWSALFEAGAHQRVEAPVYPFSPSPCWLTPAPKSPAETKQNQQTSVETFGAIVDSEATPIERQLAAIWGEVLKCATIRREDDFFDLGGNSLNGAQVLNRIASRFNLKLEFDLFYDFSTLAAFAAELTKLSGTAPVVEESTLAPISQAPLSYGQERLWFLDQLQPGNPAYNLCFGISLEGPLDIEALQSSANEISRRHQALRTVIRTESGVPMQCFAPYAPWAIPLVSIEENVSEFLAQEARTPFRLSEGPLWRMSLLRTAPEHHVLAVTMHHIVSDAWSIAIFVRELALLYRGVPLRDPAAPYSALCLRHREGSEEHLEYWKQTLAGAPEVLDLPLDRPRSAGANQRGARHPFAFPPPLVAALRAAATRENATMFMVLMAALQSLLSRYSGQQDILVGVPVAGRDSSEAEEAIGFFVNTLIVRGDLSGRPTWRDVLQRIRKSSLGAFSHQNVRFEKIVDAVRPSRSLTHSPLFQVLFMYQNIAMEDAVIPGLRCSVIEPENDTTQYDITVAIVERGGSLDGRIDYAADLFDRETVDRFAAAYLRLLEEVVANPDRRIDELALVSPHFNLGPERDWHVPAAIHELIQAAADRCPDAPALAGEGQSCSYRELTQNASQLARWMIHHGAKAGAIVAICLERSPELITAMLAALKAGAAYLILDPAYPRERMQYMLKDARPVFLVTDTHGETQWKNQDSSATPVFAISSIAATVRRYSIDPIETRAAGGDLAYIVYTSGSTGSPKGVMVSHASLVNFTCAMADEFDLTPQDRVLEFASPSFDASAVQIYPVLARGGTLVLHPNPGRLSNRELLTLCREEEITVLDVPAAFWRQMVEELSRAGIAPPPRLRVYATGGEAVPPNKVKEWAVWRGGNAMFLSSYGPTETTVTATVCRFDSEEAVALGESPLPIGRSLPNTAVLVLDTQLQPALDNCIGQAYIGGAGLARGYLNQPALTAERFIPNPYSATPGGRMYLTGDLIRRKTNGDLLFQGRQDNQRKVRGFRVELAEIESALLRHPAVSEAVAIVRLDANGNSSVAAYVAIRQGQPQPERVELREFVALRLPEYMVPSAIGYVPAVPRTVHDKVDFAALSSVELDETTPTGPAPRTAVEERLCAVWSELLGREQVNIDDNFFSLGGHSLLAVQLISRVRDALGIEVPLRTLFEAPTVRTFSNILDGRAKHAAPAIPKASRDRELPLSFSQQRFWFVHQLDAEGGKLNIPNAVELIGHLDRTALERSLTIIVQRHEALRTAFPSDGANPRQQILAPFFVQLPVLDLSSLGEDEQQTAISERVQDAASHRFHLASDPPFKVELLCLSAHRHLVLLNFHHIAFDGWSLKVFLAELGTCYSAFSQGSDPVLPELPIQYADYAVWQRQSLTPDILRDRLEEYTSRLLSAPAGLSLPTRMPRRGERPRAARHEFHLEAPQTAQDVTPFMVALAAFAAVLKRYSGQDDLIFAIDVAGRTQRETEPLIGCFVNHMLVRIDLGRTPAFRELIQRVREATLDAYANSDLPFDAVVQILRHHRPDMGQTPFQVLIVFQEPASADALVFPGIEVLPHSVAPVAPKVDLTLFLQPGADGIAGLLEYDASRFDADLIRSIADEYAGVMKASAHDMDAGIDSLGNPRHVSMLESFNESLV